MAENKGVLPSSNVNTLGNANNRWENVYANKFTGAVAGNAATATALQTARSINGTNFNGTGNITTANWGTARNISIADATATNTSTGVSVNGSGNVTLKLPATIKASLTGNVTGNVSGSSSSCTGNSATATKATQDSAGQQINSTYIKGLSISGKTITYTKGNGTTGTITTQDTVYTHPIGTVQMFAGKTIPAGWLLCNGAAISRTTYSALYNVIGTTYGGGDGGTTFALPNLIDRVVQGAATAGTYKEAGLPNITGTFAIESGKNPNYSGAFYKDGTVSNDSGFSGETGKDALTVFDASKSNPIYGNSDTVQPPALTMLPIIKY